MPPSLLFKRKDWLLLHVLRYLFGWSAPHVCLPFGYYYYTTTTNIMALLPTIKR